MASPLITALNSIQIAFGYIQAASASPIWRPPQWGNIPVPVTINGKDPFTNAPNSYVFDGIIRLEHEQRVEMTHQPVQTGAALTDHSYVVPAKLLIEIAMSDAMQSYNISNWSSAPSRSVSAFDTLVALAAARGPLQVSTRLRQYSNMLITFISAPDNYETLHGLKSLVTFEQVITANVSVTSSNTNTAANAQRPQTTVQSSAGQTQTQPVPSSVQALNNISNAPTFGVNLSTVPPIDGAGSWSSYGVSTLSNIVP